MPDAGLPGRLPFCAQFWGLDGRAAGRPGEAGRREQRGSAASIGAARGQGHLRPRSAATRSAVDFEAREGEPLPASPLADGYADVDELRTRIEPEP